MTSAPTPLRILDSLTRRPSRASVAAIGHHFVMNGVSTELHIRGLNALGDMICDWTVALLEEGINSPRAGYSVQRHAAAKLGELLGSPCGGHRRTAPLRRAVSRGIRHSLAGYR